MMYSEHIIIYILLIDKAICFLWVKLHDNDIFTDKMAGEQPAMVQMYIYSRQWECKDTQQSGMDDNRFPKCLSLPLVPQVNYHLQLQCFSTVLCKYMHFMSAH